MKKENIILVFFNELLRIQDVLRWTAISFIGFILGITIFSIWSLAAFLIATFGLLSFTFLINNFFDIDTDRNNPRRKGTNALAKGSISKKTAECFLLFFVGITIVISYFSNREVLLFSFILLLWMTIYSAPPLRLKGKPGIDVVWHFFGFVFLIIWGFLFSGSFEQINTYWFVALSLGIFGMVGQLWNHIVDYPFDKEEGTTSFVVKIGLPKAYTSIKIMIGIHLLFLLPLLWFFTFKYLLTSIIFIVGILIGFILLRPKKQGFPTRHSYEFYLTTAVGGSVYLTCLLYHLLVLLQVPLYQFL